MFRPFAAVNLLPICKGRGLARGPFPGRVGPGYRDPALTLEEVQGWVLTSPNRALNGPHRALTGPSPGPNRALPGPYQGPNLALTGPYPGPNQGPNLALTGP